MENDPISSFSDDALPCYCWKCFTKAEFFQHFGPVKEYRCPKCYIRIRLGDADYFDPLRTADDDSDSISVCTSQTTCTSRRSTIYSEGEIVDDIDNRPIDNRPSTPVNFDIIGGQTPPVPNNTPAEGAEGDVPDAPPNIAKAFADVTNYLLSVPTRQRGQRYFSGSISNISGLDVSPSRMITNVVQAYKRCSLGFDNSPIKPEKKSDDFVDQSIEIRLTPSSDTNDVKGFTPKKGSASEISSTGDNSDAGNSLG